MNYKYVFVGRYEIPLYASKETTITAIPNGRLPVGKAKVPLYARVVDTDHNEAEGEDNA